MTTSLERTEINNVDDFVSGAGLGARIGAVDVSSMSIHKHLSRNGNTGSMSALVNIEIVYEAGYTIGATYTYKSKGNLTDVDSADCRIAFAKDGEFDFDIAYLEEDSMPYKNWWVLVDKDEAVLESIVTLGTDPVCDYGDEVEAYMGEAFGFEYDETCQEAAYSLRGFFDVHKGYNAGNPISASEVDAMVRTAMVEYLEATK